MADTETREVMMEYPARLQMSMLAPVRALAAAIPEGDKEAYIVGYVIGEARGVSYRNNPNSTDGEPATALIGAFQGIPAFEDFTFDGKAYSVKDRPELASAILFLPPQAQAHIVSQVRGDDTETPKAVKRGDRVDKLGTVVPINAEIAIRKSNSPVGYEWVVRGLAKVAAISPIEHMRRALAVTTTGDIKQLVDKSETGDATPRKAPAKSGKTTAGKGKKR